MRLPITDFSLACAAGAHTNAALEKIFSGQTGLIAENDLLVGRVPGTLEPLPAAYEDFDTHQGRLAHHTTNQIGDAILAARDRWGSDRVSVLVGTSTGGIEWTEQAYLAGTRDDEASLSGNVYTRHAFGAVADLLRRIYELRGPSYCVSTACSSSAHILGSAHRLIAAGTVDAVLAIGVDTLCSLTLRGFGGLGLLSAGQCRPFDAARDGINIGEAGAAMLIERHSDEPVCWLRGFGSSSDGFHMTRPPADGAGAVASMRQALTTAGLETSDIAAVNAHGTGTVANDAAEALAIATVLGPEAIVVSTKGYTGHTLGACGAVEAVISIESLKRQQVPTTYGLREPDGELPLQAHREPVEIPGRFIMSNSFAFGGNNATIVIENV